MDQETLQQLAALLDGKLAENNKAMFAHIQQENEKLRADVQDMLHDQTEGIVQMTQRMIDAAKPEIAAEVMRHMEVLLENNQDKKIQALYEDFEAVKEDVRTLKEKAANE